MHQESLETLNKITLTAASTNTDQKRIIIHGIRGNNCNIRIANNPAVDSRNALVNNDNNLEQYFNVKDILMKNSTAASNQNQNISKDVQKMNSAISSLQNVALLGQKLVIQSIQNGKMNGEILVNNNEARNNTLPKLNCFKATNPKPASMILTSAALATPIQITAKATPAASVPASIPSSFQHPAQPMKAIISSNNNNNNNQMTQNQVQIQQQVVAASSKQQSKPIIIKTLPKTKMDNLANLTNCTVITKIPVSIAGIDVKDDPLKVSLTSNSINGKSEVEVEIPVTLPPDLDLFLTDSTSVKVLPKPEDIIPETTISTSHNNFVKVSELQTVKKILNNGKNINALNGSDLNTTIITSTNGIGGEETSYYDLKNKKKLLNPCQVKVVNKTDANNAANPIGNIFSAPNLPASNMSAAGGSVVISTSGAVSNKKPPIILNVTSSPGPPSKKLKSKVVSNVTTITGEITPEKISEILKSTNSNNIFTNPNSYAQLNMINKNDGGDVVTSKIIEFGSPRKRAKSLQTESIHQQLKQQSSTAAALKALNISMDRRHSSGAETLIQPCYSALSNSNIILNKIGSDGKFLINNGNNNENADANENTNGYNNLYEYDETQNEDNDVFGNANETESESENENENEHEAENENESCSRTVEECLDLEYEQQTSNQEPEEGVTQTDVSFTENDHISLVSDDIEMLEEEEEYLQSSQQTTTTQNSEQIEEEITEEVSIEALQSLNTEANEEPETIVPDMEIEIHPSPSLESDSKDQLTEEPVEAQDDYNKELNDAINALNEYKQVEITAEEIPNSENKETETIKTNNYNDHSDDLIIIQTEGERKQQHLPEEQTNHLDLPMDDDSNDLIIVEAPTDQIEITDEDEGQGKKNGKMRAFNINGKVINVQKKSKVHGNPASSTARASYPSMSPKMKHKSQKPPSHKSNKSFNVIKSTLTPTFDVSSLPTRLPSSYPKGLTITQQPAPSTEAKPNKQGNKSPCAGSTNPGDATSYNSMLEMISNFNMLQWKERVGKAPGTNIVFELNEYNFLQVHERCPTRNSLHTAYEKPIYERSNLSKAEKYENLYLCKRCNCHGSAIDFLAPNFCSLQCLNRDNKKRKRSSLNSSTSSNKLQGNNNNQGSKSKKLSEKHYPQQPYHQHQNQQPHHQQEQELHQHQKQQQQQQQQHEKALHNLASSSNANGQGTKSKKRFRWAKFLNEKLDGTSAPISFFLNPFPIGNNPFSIGMKLEAIDPENCSLFCICTVADIRGYRIKLHFDGYASIYDFWVNADSMDIFPLGWCSRTGRVLQPPRNQDPKTFNLKKYVEFSGSIVASRSIFTHLKSTSSDIVNPFKIGMHLEAEDLNDTGKLCVATVADVINDRIRIHFDGWDDCYDYWVHISSPYIHPCGWHEGRQQLIVPPDYENLPFIWSDYIESLGKGSPATNDLFCVRDPIDFQPNMKLEVVDPRNPNLIRPASIVQRKGHRIKIQLECWPAEYCFWLEDDSPDLHPVGWCYQTGHEIEPPPGFEQKPTRFKCQIQGCRGLGNAKKLSEKIHTNIDECPYSMINWRIKMEKPQRINCTDIVRAPEETAPFVEIKKENLPLLSNPAQAYLLNKKTFNNENHLLKTSTHCRKSKQKPEKETYNNGSCATSGISSSNACTTDYLVKPMVIKEEASNPKQANETPNETSLKNSLSTTIKEEQKPQNISASTSTSASAASNETIISNEISKEMISTEMPVQQAQASLNDSKKDVVILEDLPLEMKIAKEFLCDYGPRLHQSFQLIEKHFNFNPENVTSNPMLWDVRQTADYIEQILKSKRTANHFAKAEIDGTALLMLQQNDLTDLMGIKMGPAVKLYFTILQLRILCVKKYKIQYDGDVIASITSAASEAPMTAT